MTDSDASSSSRRLLLTGAAAALAGGAVLGSTETASAADGQAVLAGRANTATQATYLTSSTTARGLTVTTTNAATTAHALGGFAKGGAGLHAESSTGHGSLLRTRNAKTWGAWVTNQGGTAGPGGALRADGNTLLNGSTKVVGDPSRLDQPALVVDRTQLTPEEYKGAGLLSVRGPRGWEVEGSLRQRGFSRYPGEFIGPKGILVVAYEGVGAAAVQGISSGDGVAFRGSTDGPNGLGLLLHSARAIEAHGRTLLDGPVDIVGPLSKPAGSFKIDHPLDPMNKYLYHSFVESPDMKNVYDGVVVADAAGEAVVELPEWFEALNSDFRYQLTPLGGSAPELHVRREISDGSFALAGARPGQRISWQVTGIRHDTYARENRIPVEQDKPDEERGRYLYSPQGD